MDTTRRKKLVLGVGLPELGKPQEQFQERDSLKLLDAIAKFDKHLCSFDEVQSEVELALDEKDLEADIDASCVLVQMEKEERLWAKWMEDLTNENAEFWYQKGA